VNPPDPSQDPGCPNDFTSDEPAPSLHHDYRGFTTTTSRSASACRDGTQRLQFLLYGALPIATCNPSRQRYRHPPSHVPRRCGRSDSRRLHAGHHLARRWDPARLIPESVLWPRFRCHL